VKYQDSKQDGRHNKDEYPKFRLEFEPLYQRRPSSQLPFIQPKARRAHNVLDERSEVPLDIERHFVLLTNQECPNDEG